MIKPSVEQSCNTHACIETRCPGYNGNSCSNVSSAYCRHSYCSSDIENGGYTTCDYDIKLVWDGSVICTGTYTEVGGYSSGCYHQVDRYRYYIKNGYKYTITNGISNGYCYNGWYWTCYCLTREPI